MVVAGTLIGGNVVNLALRAADRLSGGGWREHYSGWLIAFEDHFYFGVILYELSNRLKSKVAFAVSIYCRGIGRTFRQTEK